MSRILYVTDLDGTLLNIDSEISKYSKTTLNELIKQGVLFTYATARSLHSAEPLTKELTLDFPVIIYNGCAIINTKTKEVLYRCSFSKQQIAFIEQVLKNKHPFVYSYINDKETVLYQQEYINEGMQFYLDKRQGDARFYPSKDLNIYQGDIFYFTCIGKKEDLQDAYDRLKNQEEYHVVFHQELYRNEYWLEVMPKLATKANAILKLKELFKIDKIVSFGDAINDIPMFLISDECYAVDNAVKELKEIATGIIESNQQDGVVKWLKNHGEMS